MSALRFLCGVASVALALALPCGIAKAQYLTIDDPLSYTGVGSVATSIDGNNIVGTYYPGNGNGYGFLYNGTTYTTLDDPLSAGHTSAGLVSGSNIVGGYIGSGGVFYDYLYNGATYTTLNDPLAPYEGVTFASGLAGNNVFGYYLGSSDTNHGFVYNSGTYTTLDDPMAGKGIVNAPYGSFYFSGTYPLGMSGKNIYGNYVDDNGNSHGFVYNGTTYTTLDDPAAAIGSNFGTIVTGMSGSTVVGYYFDSSGNTHGFVYNGTSYTTLDDPLAVYGSYIDEISGGIILGDYIDSSFNDVSFLYDGTTFTPIEDPLGAAHSTAAGFSFGPTTSSEAMSGSNIVGQYRDSNGNIHGFLYHVVPEPGSVALLISLGITGIGCIAHLKKRSG